jgi:hypothetical protein
MQAYIYICVCVRACFKLSIDTRRSWDSSVGIALGCELDDWGSRKGLGNLLFTTASRPTLGPTQPPIQWVLGALSSGVQRPGREADHSLPSSAEVKNAWSYTSTPPLRLHGVVLNKSIGKTIPLPLLHMCTST